MHPIDQENQADFDAAIATNTVEGWEAFLAKHRRGRHHAKAQQNLDKLKADPLTLQKASDAVDAAAAHKTFTGKQAADLRAAAEKAAVDADAAEGAAADADKAHQAALETKRQAQAAQVVRDERAKADADRAADEERKRQEAANEAARQQQPQPQSQPHETQAEEPIGREGE